MALDDILSRIEHEAENRKRSILADARDEVESRLGRAKQMIEKEAEALLEQRKREAGLVVQRELAEANLEGRNRIGRVKAEALRHTKEKLLESLLQALDGSLEVWTRNILLSNSTSRDEEVWMAPPEASRLGKKFLDQLNREQGTSFTYGGEAQNISRGFMIKKRGMVMNLSLQSLADDVFRAHERDIAALLFQDAEA